MRVSFKRQLAIGVAALLSTVGLDFGLIGTGVGASPTGVCPSILKSLAPPGAIIIYCNNFDGPYVIH